MKIGGEWPGTIAIKDRWAKATARSWNEDLPYGYLRLERGGAAFLEAAARHVLTYGVELVASHPVTDGATDTWQAAGFLPFLDLHLYRRSLVGSLPPAQEGIQVTRPDFDILADIDRRSFQPLWRSGRNGLQESHRATVRRVVLVAGADPRPDGFAIVGTSGVTAYLQRIAVTPSHRGHGWGTRLTLASVRWAARHGAATMLLNTPLQNRPAAALYRSTGFHRLPERLRILRYPGDAIE